LTIDRRSILKFAGPVPLISAAARVAWAADDIAAEKVDYTLRIATGLVELAPKHIVSTVLYNQQFPGPLLRFTEGRRAIVDLHNDTDTPELVHWHGQMIPSEVDGAAEEGSPFVPPHGTRRIAFVPKPAGFRFVHSHVIAGDPVKELQLKGKAADEQTNGAPKGFEVGYELFAINGRMLGHGEPIRVKRGERVLFHILNASAGETRSLALPGPVARYGRTHLGDRRDEAPRGLGAR
jgi:hypothetical protein